MPRLRFSHLEIDTERRELWRSGCAVEVQPRILQLICHLAANHGHTVSREELVAEVWDGVHVSPAALDRAVSAARCLLGERLARLDLGLAGQDRIDEPVHLRLGVGADEHVDRLASAEGHDGGDALALHGLEQSIADRVGVDVELHDFDAAGVLLGQLLDLGRDHATRPAPGGPEIDHDGLVAPQDIGLPGCVGDFSYVGHRSISPFLTG